MSNSNGIFFKSIQRAAAAGRLTVGCGEVKERKIEILRVSGPSLSLALRDFQGS
mgnify:CR=1 FL=1